MHQVWDVKSGQTLLYLLWDHGMREAFHGRSTKGGMQWLAEEGSSPLEVLISPHIVLTYCTCQSSLYRP